MHWCGHQSYPIETKLWKGAQSASQKLHGSKALQTSFRWFQFYLFSLLILIYVQIQMTKFLYESFGKLEYETSVLREVKSLLVLVDLWS